MTFSELNQDIFNMSDEDGVYFAHCISRDYAMGAGIAVMFNKRYDMRRKLQAMNPSEAMLVDNVFNLVTKSKYWQKPTYDSLVKSLECMKEQVLNIPTLKTLAMPKIGCGLDKLSWGKVRRIIKSVFDDTDINIVICYL